MIVKRNWKTIMAMKRLEFPPNSNSTIVFMPLVILWSCFQKESDWIDLLCDSMKMNHVFRLISHAIYYYFTIFCRRYVLFCLCFRYLLITEHMRVQSRKGSEMVKKNAKMQHFGCMGFAMALWHPPWHQDTSALHLKLMATAMNLMATSICLQ